MRISSSMLHDQGSVAMGRAQERLVRLQNQLSSGKRVNTPSDDPIAAAAGIRLADSIAKNKQFLANQLIAKNNVQYGEQVVAEIGDTLQGLRERLIQGANGTLNASDRRSIADELRSRYDGLLALANARDESGNFLFSGGLTTTQPFFDAPGGATYAGDQGLRSIQVSPSRTVPVGVNGDELFMRVRTGNGVFATSAGASNTGSGVIDQGSVADFSLLNNGAYQIAFTVIGASTTYSVIDSATSTTVSSGNVYTSGAGIQIAGMQVSVSGAPANGDTFSLQPSPTQSIFTTFKQVIDTLDRGYSTAAERARFDNEMAAGIANLDQGLERTLTIRAQMGSNLRELELMTDSMQGQQNALQGELSDLVDLDYAAAVSQFTREQQGLEAARNAYARIAQRTLFDVI
jgi:flagellar hook-associated protein 3 FlgL